MAWVEATFHLAGNKLRKLHCLALSDLCEGNVSFRMGLPKYIHTWALPVFSGFQRKQECTKSFSLSVRLCTLRSFGIQLEPVELAVVTPGGLVLVGPHFGP